MNLQKLFSGFISFLFFVSSVNTHAQNNSSQEGMTIAIEFKDGKILGKEDIKFIDFIGKSPATNQKGAVEIAEARVNKRIFTIGQKLTLSDVEFLNKAVEKYASKKKMKKQDTKKRGATCEWCQWNCRFYKYYWCNGYCICYYCE